jgi:hypothetical protein
MNSTALATSTVTPFDRPAPTPVLTPEQTARYLTVSISTLARWRIAGAGGPAFIRLSPQKIGYRQSDLDKFLEARVRTSTSQS